MASISHVFCFTETLDITKLGCSRDLMIQLKCLPVLSEWTCPNKVIKITALFL